MQIRSKQDSGSIGYVRRRRRSNAKTDLRNWPQPCRCLPRSIRWSVAYTTGTITYSFRDLPRTPGADDAVDVMIKALTECGIGEIELFSPHIEPAYPGGRGEAQRSLNSCVNGACRRPQNTSSKCESVSMTRASRCLLIPLISGTILPTKNWKKLSSRPRRSASASSPPRHTDSRQAACSFSGKTQDLRGDAWSLRYQKSG